jgi:hypothetical protein
LFAITEGIYGTLLFSDHSFGTEDATSHKYSSQHPFSWSTEVLRSLDVKSCGFLFKQNVDNFTNE